MKSNDYIHHEREVVIFTSTYNKETIKSRFQAAQYSYPEAAIAQQQINQRLIDILATTNQTKFKNVLEIGCGTGDFTQRLANYAEIDNWLLNDLYQSDAVMQYLADQSWHSNVSFLLGDIEQIQLPHQLDLIVSASAIQWLNDKAMFLQHCAKQLNEKGILLFNSFAPDNLFEIRQLTGIGLVYPTLEQWQQWLERDFVIKHLSTETICLTFDSPLRVLQHLRATGVTATQQQFWTKRKLQNFIAEYQQQFTTKNGQVSLTYCPIYVMVEKKLF